MKRTDSRLLCGPDPFRHRRRRLRLRDHHVQQRQGVPGQLVRAHFRRELVRRAAGHHRDDRRGSHRLIGLILLLTRRKESAEGRSPHAVLGERGTRVRRPRRTRTRVPAFARRRARPVSSNAEVHMILVREVFQVKYGRMKEAKGLMKEMVGMMPAPRGRPDAASHRPGRPVLHPHHGEYPQGPRRLRGEHERGDVQARVRRAVPEVHPAHRLREEGDLHDRVTVRSIGRASTGRAGRLTTNSLPSPRVELTATVPSCSSASRFTRLSPRPVPGMLAVCSPRTR